MKCFPIILTQCVQYSRRRTTYETDVGIALFFAIAWGDSVARGDSTTQGFNAICVTTLPGATEIRRPSP